MALRTLRRNVPVLAMIAWGAPAWAATVALAPPIQGRGISAEEVGDLFALMSSELEFMPGVDEVIELEPAPAALVVSCLDSTRCLGAITREAGAEVLVTGAMEKLGQRLAVDLLYYDATLNRVLRRKTYDLPATASELVDEIGPVLQETFTGTSPKREAESEAMTDVSFEQDDAGRREPEPEPEPEPAPRTTGSTSTRVVSEPIAPPPEPEPAEDFDPNAFSFGGTAEDITFGSSSSGVAYAEPAAEPEPEPEPPRPPPSRSYEDEDEEDDDEPIRPPTGTSRDDSGPSRDRFDEDSTRSRTSRGSSKGSKDGFRRVHLNVRGGYTNYGVFHFATVNGEIGVRPVGGLFLVVGGSLDIVRREKAPQIVAEQGCAKPPAADGRCIETNFIVPINAGLLYHFKGGVFQPYLGADAIFSQYYRDPTTQKASWTVGARGRLGADILFTEHFGLNLDAALGFWLGKDWPNVDPRLKELGFLPTVTGGLVFAF